MTQTRLFGVQSIPKKKKKKIAFSLGSGDCSVGFFALWKREKKITKQNLFWRKYLWGFMPWNCSFDLKFPEGCAGFSWGFCWFFLFFVCVCFSIFSSFSKSLNFKKSFAFKRFFPLLFFLFVFLCNNPIFGCFWSFFWSVNIPAKLWFDWFKSFPFPEDYSRGFWLLLQQIPWVFLGQGKFLIPINN